MTFYRRRFPPKKPRLKRFPRTIPEKRKNLSKLPGACATKTVTICPPLPATIFHYFQSNIMTITYSIIAPIYNEFDNLPELYRRVKEVMDSTGKTWELILVDDGSSDGSTDRIRELAAKDTTVRPVIFARNFGHQIAVTAGLDYSRGDAVVVIDADLQDPPELIAEMAARWREGYEVIYAVRAEREGESAFKLWTASLFYRIIY